MPQYVYKASDLAGKILEGVMDAPNQEICKNKLQEMDYMVIAIHEQKKVASKSIDLKFLKQLRRVPKGEVLAFTQQLATLVNAGLTLDRSLMILYELNSNQRFREIILTLHKNVQGGSSFADALARNPRLFSNLYVNMVKVGETGGVLEPILTRLAEFLEEMQELKTFLVSVMFYPLILLVVGGMALIFIMTFVIPKFTVIIQDMGQTLPLPTQILMAVSGFIASYWYLIILAVVFTVVGFRSYINTSKGRKQWDRFRLGAPVFGHLTRKVAISRFARTLGTLTGSGVPILQALFIVKDIIGNAVISDAILEVHGAVKEGEGIARPLQESGVFPPMAVHMISVGEETGKLEKMLIKIADVYEADIKTTVKRLTTLIEPVMILVMAALVGFVVLSLVLAIFSINSMPT